ncbi:WXG100 family type VII secretion target [Nocardia sp. NEAU-G5]|uniref:WXG100 family type VII secretion target n=1 Tax=Nocardia albiluteola TaxID=2842303 RepID=A0ABS6B783_9NOCA|nr:WXG100 family type VII secretion target [Nocardia albiluteola]MBU3065993.1 WXG100 family type VII secretion target [Nocardia albiluteola]
MNTTGGNTAGSDLGVHIVPDKVLAYGHRVADIAQTLQSALHSVHTEVDDLLENGWKGPTATEFTSGWNETHESGQQILSALCDMAAKLGVSVDFYRTDDAGSGDRIRGIER